MFSSQLDRTCLYAAKYLLYSTLLYSGKDKFPVSTYVALSTDTFVQLYMFRSVTIVMLKGTSTSDVSTVSTLYLHKYVRRTLGSGW